jgi:hypothetical protein
MVATRRTGLAFVAAAAVLFVVRGVQARRVGGLRSEARLAAMAVLGGLVGWSPELVVSLLEGEAVRPYTEGVVSSHLGAGVRAWESGKSRSIALRAAAQHAAYYPLSSLGLALMFPMVLLGRGRRIDLPAGVRATVGFVTAGAFFLASLSTLHVVRYWFRRDLEKGYDLYPRYLDPLEPVWLLLGFGLACALMGEGRLRRLAPWAAAAGVAAVLSERVIRPRGYRLPWGNAITDRLGWPFDPDRYFLCLCVAVLVVVCGLVWRGLMNRSWVPWAAVALSWGLSAHLVVQWTSHGPPTIRVPEVLVVHPLGTVPAAELAVVLPPSPARVDFYKLAFKTNHRIRFLAEPQLEVWMREHRQGFVVVRRRDRIRVERRLIREVSGWLVYAAAPDEPQR